MSAPSRLTSFYPVANPVRHTQPGPCFRTDSEGRIALTRDWRKLFSAARRFDSLALQTRHAYVRLIHIGALPELAWTAAGATASFPTGSLRLHPARWGAVSGRLAECACCGTPGRVEIENAHGLDFLQLCALAECEPATWAHFLSETLADREPSPPPPPPPPPATPLNFFCAPAEAVPVGDAPPGEALPDFVAALSDAEVPFTVVLRTHEADHVREFCPHRVTLHGGILTAQAATTTLQIGLPAVRQLAVGLSPAHGPQLHLLGPNDALLLTLSAAPEAAHAARWAATLHAAFPFSTHD